MLSRPTDAGSPTVQTLGRAEPGPSTTVHARVWFGDPARPLAGWVSAPADGLVRSGVVLCPPLGEEGRSAHRTYRRLAETLAAKGLVALRFDYDGTGDSAGAMADPGRVPAWLDSTLAAHGYLTSLGAPEVAALGMRLGGTIAACAAAKLAESGAAWSSLVLWDPCASGRFFLRESEALHAFGREDNAPDDGLRHTPGFQYDAETARALRGLDLTRIDPDQRLAAHVRLLSRADRPVDPAIEARLGLIEGTLSRSTAHDQHLLLDRPPSNGQVPQRSIDEIVSFLLETAPTESVALALPQRHPDAGVLLDALPPQGGATVRVRERSVALTDVGLAGVVVEPDGGAEAAAALDRAAQRRRRAPHRAGPPLGGVRPSVGRAGSPLSAGRLQRHR